MRHIDAELFAELQKLPKLTFGRMVRQDRAPLLAARERFLHDGTPPVFSYTKALGYNAASAQRAIADFDDWLTHRQGHEPAGVIELYRQKANELATRAALISAIQRGDDVTVTACATQLFEQPRQTYSELEKEFEAVLSRAAAFQRHTPSVTTATFVTMTRRVLDHYGLHAWNIRLTKRSSVKIGRSKDGASGVVRVPRDLAISRARAARLLTHEVEVHALRTANGLASPLRLLARGLANYTITDEGLAIYFQQQLRSPEAIDPGFWDAWAVALTAEHPFSETFRILKTARQRLGEAIHEDDPETMAIDTAWRLCVRVYRGITNPEQVGVGFQRDHVYRSGLAMIREAVDAQGPEVIGQLFVGHAHLNHLPLLRALNIPPARTPDMISRAVVREVMREQQKRA